jgi:hypothetical protein
MNHQSPQYCRNLFVASAMFVTFFLATSASAVSAPQNTPVDPYTQDSRILTDVEIKQLAGFMVKYGHDAPLDFSVTTALGLTRPGDVEMTLRQLNVTPPNQMVHAYHVLDDGGYLIVTRTHVSARIYRANAQQELVAAVDKVTNQAPVAIPVEFAQKELKAELAYWAKIADQYAGKL